MKLRGLIHNYLFFNIRELGGVRLHRATVIGEMGTGKTTLMARIAELLLQHYGEENVNIVRSQFLGNILKYLDDRPIQCLLLDDPLYYHFSHGFSRERKENVSQLAAIRHIWRKTYGIQKGLIILLVATQYYFVLDPFFRNAPLLMFKSVLNDPRDRYYLRKLVGKQKYMELAKQTFKIFFKRSEEAKSRVLIKPIGAKARWIEYQLPRINIEKYSVDDTPYIAEKQKHILGLDEKDRQILYLRLKGKKITQIAEIIGLAPSRVSERITKAITKLGLE